jgi:hypothetical protein
MSNAEETFCEEAVKPFEELRQSLALFLPQ